MKISFVANQIQHQCGSTNDLFRPKENSATFTHVTKKKQLLRFFFISVIQFLME